MTLATLLAPSKSVLRNLAGQVQSAALAAFFSDVITYLKTGPTDRLVKATCAAADATGGATGSAFTLSLVQVDGTAVTSARQVMVTLGSTRYEPVTLDSSPTFGSATTGSIIASGNGWALVQTSAAGAFACTITNATDETLYVSARTAHSGVSVADTGCVVVESNSDSVAWSA